MLSLPTADIPFGGSSPDAQAIPYARISALGVAHDDLDAAINALARSITHDDQIIVRLKKRKLQIRDEIAGLVAVVSEEHAATSGQEAGAANG
jgi:hypothetical protein